MGSVGREIEAGGAAKGKAGRQALQESRRSGIQSFQDSSRAETRLSRLQRAGIVLGFDGPDSPRVRPRLFCSCLVAGAAGLYWSRAVGGIGLTCGGGAPGHPAPRRSRPRPKNRSAAGSGGACAGVRDAAGRIAAEWVPEPPALR